MNEIRKKKRNKQSNVKMKRQCRKHEKKINQRMTFKKLITSTLMLFIESYLDFNTRDYARTDPHTATDSVDFGSNL